MKLAFKLSSAALLVAASISAAQAGGFMLTEQSVTNQGRAFAGAGIVGDDLSAVWFNPAGMTLLPGTSAQIGATLISLNLKAKSNDGLQTDNGATRKCRFRALILCISCLLTCGWAWASRRPLVCRLPIVMIGVSRKITGQTCMTAA